MLFRSQLARERGLELPAMGGGRRAERSGEAPAITTRTVYKFGGTPEKPVLTAVTVKLGITDGSNTEVIEGLEEGDVLVASVIIPGATGSAPSPAGSSPFGGAPRRF